MIKWSVKKKDSTPTVSRRLLTNAKKAVFNTSVDTVSYLRVLRMTGGTTPERLRRRSGKLAASTQAVQPKVRATVVEGGVQFGTKYAAVHIGETGGKTLIRPKAKKWLTIPLPAAQNPSGTTKGTALSGRWGATFFAKSKHGNLILFGRQRVSKGKNVGKLRGKVMPLFVLKKSVTVPVRITFKSVFDFALKRLKESLKIFGF